MKFSDAHFKKQVVRIVNECPGIYASDLFINLLTFYHLQGEHMEMSHYVEVVDEMVNAQEIACGDMEYYYPITLTMLWKGFIL